MSTSYSRSPTFGNIKSSATTTQAQSIRVDSKDTLSVAFVGSASTETTSYIHIVETSTNAATFVTAEMGAGSSNTSSTTIRSSSTSEKTISCVQTENAWRRNLLCLTRRWISRPIK